EAKHLWTFSSDAPESCETRFFVSLRMTGTLSPSSAGAAEDSAKQAAISRPNSELERQPVLPFQLSPWKLRTKTSRVRSGTLNAQARDNAMLTTVERRIGHDRK